MKIFKKKIKGLISYFNLESFWLEELNDKERKIVLDNFNSGSIGLSRKDLLENFISDNSYSKLSFIKGQISRFTKPEFKEIGRKFIDLGNKEILNQKDILDRHFYYGTLIKYHYRHREENDNMELAIKACNEQISISKDVKNEFKKDYPTDNLPSHAGFEQLAIIFEKSKKYTEGIELCNTAHAEG
jgi:hypothetical protein